MPDRVTNTNPSVVDTVCALLGLAVVVFVLFVLWSAAAGNLPSQQPTPTTWFSGDGDQVEVTG